MNLEARGLYNKVVTLVKAETLLEEGYIKSFEDVMNFEETYKIFRKAVGYRD